LGFTILESDKSLSCGEGSRVGGACLLFWRLAHGEALQEDHDMRSRRNLYLLIAALLLLLGAISIENFNAGAAAVSAVFSVGTLISLLKELSFAILIALLVIVSIEHESRKTDRESADRMRREIADDVFKGVFSRDLSPGYVDKAISLHLKPSLVRTYVKIDYAFEDFSQAERNKYGDGASELILLRSRIEFCLTNVTHRPIREDFRFTNPTWGGPLSDLTRIVRFDVGETKGSLRNAKDELQFTEREGRRSYSVAIDFEPDASRYLVIEGLLLKEISDSHTWASFYPTMKADVSVTSMDFMSYGISMNSTTPAVEAHRSANGLFARWEIDGPIMTNESIILWWRDDPNEDRANLPAPISD
jgi:hypothetical protein